MSVFYNHTVLRYRPGTKTNRAGETVLDLAGLAAAVRDGSALAVARTDVHVRPTSQAEIVAEDRSAEASEWRVASEPGSGDWDIHADDWIRLPDGTLTAVVGDPARPSDPLTGNLHHVEVLVRKVTG